jgi:predicted O-methyltransferase YrrM
VLANQRGGSRSSSSGTTKVILSRRTRRRSDLAGRSRYDFVVLAPTLARRLVSLMHRFPLLARLLYRVRYGLFGPDLARAASIPTWLGHQESLALASSSYALPVNAVVVEIGSFLGKSAIILASARKKRGSGRVHCVDPFDASGDAFSVSAYRAIAEADPRPLRARFQANIERAGLADWVIVHEGTAATIAAAWTEPIDMLFLDGDQSPDGARLAYDAWAPFLKVGGIVAVHNSDERVYAPSHDGMYLLASRMLHPPRYADVHCIDTTTFARRVS